MFWAVWCGFLLYGGILSPKVTRYGCPVREPVPTVAFLGPEGTNSQQAALDYFPANYTFVVSTSINNVFQSVLKKQTDLGMVPFENSIGGKVNDTMHNLADEPSIFVTGELFLKISHNLARKPSDLKQDDYSQIKKIYSHPQGLTQCKNFILKNIPGAKTIPVASTALAAKMANDDPTAAAISNLAACALYKLDVLKYDIQDVGNNTTRFLSIQSPISLPIEMDLKNYANYNYHTLISIGVENAAGKLEDIKNFFGKLSITLVYLDPFPSKGDSKTLNTYLAQVKGHPNHEPLEKALEDLKALSKNIRIVGVFSNTHKHIN